jgi:adenine-specific DNA-methyltransferase
MKYMGSKRAMLRNGLGALLEHEIDGAERFVDLFTGSAAVATHVAQKFDVPVVASDLQRYSVVLAGAVIERRQKLEWKRGWEIWHKKAKVRVNRLGKIPALARRVTKADVLGYRRWCESRSELPITAAYGGHYFSPRQAVWIDALRSSLPNGASARNVALAALIQATSQCVAAPGHTAQPFQPTRTSKKFLTEAWGRDIVQKTKRAFAALSATSARKKGSARKADANEIAKKLRKSDLVFVDPPYSGVHYSRFYHVLESISRGRCGKVSGVGRYPAQKQRPRSRYSLQTESGLALDELLKTIASRGSKVILTFPNHRCSNGLSGHSVHKIATRHFRVTRRTIASRFSTLGGTSDNRGDEAGRAARRYTRELVLILTQI